MSSTGICIFLVDWDLRVSVNVTSTCVCTCSWRNILCNCNFLVFRVVCGSVNVLKGFFPISLHNHIFDKRRDGTNRQYSSLYSVRGDWGTFCSFWKMPLLNWFAWNIKTIISKVPLNIKNYWIFYYEFRLFKKIAIKNLIWIIFNHFFLRYTKF